VKKKSRQMLITTEIIGAFMILIGALAIMQDNALLLRIFYLLFFMTLIAATLFGVFLALAVKQHKHGSKK
jgi:magnesium-transporting ATPase (P-type)